MFYATFLLVRKLKEHKQFDMFIKNRAAFENFIYQYDNLFDQINRNLRSSKKSALTISDLLYEIIKAFDKGQDSNAILLKIQKEYNVIIDNSDNIGESQNSELKSATFISNALPTVLKCSICGGAIHTNSISMDHIIRK